VIECTTASKAGCMLLSYTEFTYRIAMLNLKPATMKTFIVAKLYAQLVLGNCFINYVQSREWIFVILTRFFFISWLYVLKY
jgi:hypothetical protein